MILTTERHGETRKGGFTQITRKKAQICADFSFNHGRHGKARKGGLARWRDGEVARWGGGLDSVAALRNDGEG